MEQFLTDFEIWIKIPNSPHLPRRPSRVWSSGSWRPGPRWPWRKSLGAKCTRSGSKGCPSSSDFGTPHRFCKASPDSNFENRSLIVSSYLWMHDSIISQAISFNLWLRCWANSGSGQCKSLMKLWRASSFHSRSSEVAQPLLQRDLKIKNQNPEIKLPPCNATRCPATVTLITIYSTF